jgi:hypothetical protein
MNFYNNTVYYNLFNTSAIHSDSAIKNLAYEQTEQLSHIMIEVLGDEITDEATIFTFYLYISWAFIVANAGLEEEKQLFINNLITGLIKENQIPLEHYFNNPEWRQRMFEKYKMGLLEIKNHVWQENGSQESLQWLTRWKKLCREITCQFNKDLQLKNESGATISRKRFQFQMLLFKNLAIQLDISPAAIAATLYCIQLEV